VTKQPRAVDLADHARGLAEAFKLRLIESPQLRPDEAVALSHIGVALVAPIIDETTYAVALHELGHLASPTGALRAAIARGTSLSPEDRARLMRDEEDAAWTWARHYALTWTALMDSLANWAEGTYAAPAPAPTPAAPTVQQTKIDWSRY